MPRQALGPSAEAMSGQCAVTIDYEAKLLQGSANASTAPFVGSLDIQNTSPGVRGSPSHVMLQNTLKMSLQQQLGLAEHTNTP